MRLRTALKKLHLVVSDNAKGSEDRKWLARCLRGARRTYPGIAGPAAAKVARRQYTCWRD